MMNKKVLPFLIPAIAALVFFFANSWGKNNEAADSKEAKILTKIGEYLQIAHFSPKPINDAFSGEVFTNVLKSLDADKMLFLKNDVKELEQFKDKLDDEIKTGSSNFSPALQKIYLQRTDEVEKIVAEILSKPFNFNTNELLQADREKADWPTSEKERKELWQKKIKYMVLDRYAAELDTRDKNKDSAKFVYKADSTLERESRERVDKIFHKSFERQKKKATEEEIFNNYVNVITSTMDPHTNFFPPVERRSFDEQMSAHFYGIGAQLSEQDGFIKIVSVVSGSPAWKSGQIQANDIILKVAQGSAEPVDITGYETQDAVKIIRGQKDSEVRLTIKKVDGSIKVVSLIREKIDQDESRIRSVILNNGGQKIGYIYVPDFYMDVNGGTNVSCADDMASEIVKLKAQNVEGMIVDLRFNGGGFLGEAIKMVGFFIDEGPVVQVKSRSNSSQVLRDKDKGVLYDGPLAVMINEYSASASEIFAGAIQDYGRGIIVGGTSFGKGTVQRQIPLETGSFFNKSNAQEEDLGSLKITIQKFYRISGSSNQIKGIVPDISIPDTYEYTESREKYEKSALPWDEISKSQYALWENAGIYDNVKRTYQQKINSDSSFNIIQNNSKWLFENGKKDINLNLNAYRQNLKAISQVVEKSREKLSLKDPIKAEYTKEDQAKIETLDKDKAERYKAWLKNIEKDVYVNQAKQIISAVSGDYKLTKK